MAKKIISLSAVKNFFFKETILICLFQNRGK